MEFGNIIRRFLRVIEKRRLKTNTMVKPAPLSRHVGIDRFGNDLYIPLPDDDNPNRPHPWNKFDTAESRYDLHTAAHSIAIDNEFDGRVYSHYMFHSKLNLEKAQEIDPLGWGMPVKRTRRHTFNGGLHGRRIRCIEKRPRFWLGYD